MRYAVNGFLLIVPLLLLDALLGNRLPREYQKQSWNAVPRWLSVAETALRIPVLLVPLLLPISLSGPVQQAGAVLYLVGVLAYAAAWAAQIRHPHSAWSVSTAGFLAPAYTPALWLTGIALVGAEPVLPHLGFLPAVFLGFVAAFLVTHNLHALYVHRHRI
ncbi:hypothetical protein AB0J90_23815 [Micromonospora sp. NPDC049523]|uniref:hypothetical protein n=1 Tax=Micromonospora sp. NPDC049523 TaxID=3155921 RepID=UPI00342D6EBF